MRALALGLAIAAGTPAPLLAQAAPRALWEKSIVVRWSEEREQRVLPDGRMEQVRIERMTELYISSVGRVFRRESSERYGAGRRGRYNRGSADLAPETSAPLRFQGQSATITIPARDGARQASMRFDATFGTCEARVLSGRIEGRGPFVVKSHISGRDVEVHSNCTGAATCDVVSGNVLQR